MHDTLKLVYFTRFLYYFIFCKLFTFQSAIFVIITESNPFLKERKKKIDIIALCLVILLLALCHCFHANKLHRPQRTHAAIPGVPYGAQKVRTMPSLCYQYPYKSTCTQSLEGDL